MRRNGNSVMLAAGALLISLTILGAHGQNDGGHAANPDEVIVFTSAAVDPHEFYADIFDRLPNIGATCRDSPCLRGASCFPQPGPDFKCLCPEPYTGKRCQTMKNPCENITCVHGDCVVNRNIPFPPAECKCTPPYQGPDCATLPTSLCDPNPCQNGGLCVERGPFLSCACPDGYTGKFCEVAPTDCYSGNGWRYRGVVSVTVDDEECLDWRSNFLLSHGEDPFVKNPFFGGMNNNHCRNPDADIAPWCFVKKEGYVSWNYCKMRQCSEATPPPTAAPVPEQFSQCGRSLSSITGKIFGGLKSLPGIHPWQVSLQRRQKGSNSEFYHFCGGILISSCWVLTAAHCIDDYHDYQAVLGGVNIVKDEAMDQIIPVNETILHEEYRHTSKALYNDVALLKLQVTDSPHCAKETKYVKTACLKDIQFPAGKECVISGWGKTENKSGSRHLLSADVVLISAEQCNAANFYNGLIDDSMVCAGTWEGGVDSCKGDSGGPLVCERDGEYNIVGVVSWGTGCGVRDKPGVYANVRHFLEWINSKTGSE